MARNYKRDSKGRFAKFNSKRKANLARNRKTKAAQRKAGAQIFRVTKGRDGTMVASNLNQIRSRQNHAIAGAAIGTVIFPGVGTIAGGLAGHAVGASRKKNRPLVIRSR